MAQGGKRNATLTSLLSLSALSDCSSSSADTSSDALAAPPSHPRSHTSIRLSISPRLTHRLKATTVFLLHPFFIFSSDQTYEQLRSEMKSLPGPKGTSRLFGRCLIPRCFSSLLSSFSSARSLLLPSPFSLRLSGRLLYCRGNQSHLLPAPQCPAIQSRQKPANDGEAGNLRVGQHAREERGGGECPNKRS